MDREFLRFQGAEWFDPDKQETVVVGGAGGIGSWCSLFLARANFKVILIDFDIFEEHNLGGQFVELSGINQHKVSAIQDAISKFTTNRISTFTERIDESSMTHKYMFGGFDNMTARKDMFNIWKRSWESYNSPLLIDGRLNLETFQIFCVTPNTADKYEKEYLFGEGEALEAICSMKQTSHAAAMIGAHMVGFFTNHICNVKLQNKVREIPFMYEYAIPMDLTVRL